MMKKKSSIAILLTLIFSLVLSACSGGGNKLTVGTQVYTETKIIGYMYQQLIEDNTDIKVDVKTDMATDTLILEAMMNDELEIATTYTGTALSSFFSIDDPRDREGTIQQTKDLFAEEYNIEVFDTLGFANTYALGVKQTYAEENDITKVSDLKPIADEVKFGSDQSWLERKGEDGYEAFTELYEFEFGEVASMSTLVYDALKNDDMDVGLIYSTDARIDIFELETLEDDLSFFPPYDAHTFVTQETLDENEGLEEILNKLVGQIDVDTIRELNKKVDIDGEEPKDVAVEFLKEKGLLE